MKRLLIALILGPIAMCGFRAEGQEQQQLAQDALAIFKEHCYRCHGENGRRDGKVDILDLAGLVQQEKIIPRNASDSRIIRLIKKGAMPKDDLTEVSEAEVALLKRWIDAGAPPPQGPPADKRTFKTTRDSHQAMHGYLRNNVRPADRRFIRFFTLQNLHNAGVKDLDLGRAAFSLVVNSLSWQRAIVAPAMVDQEKTLLAINLRELGWDLELWDEIVRDYPYALLHDQIPADPTINKMAKDIYEITQSDVPVVRADWFIATVTRPPLYHTVLGIPKSARVLEEALAVTLTENLLRGKAIRAGFTKSGVSGQGRIVERHPARFGGYYISRDFLTSLDRGNFFNFPLGPDFPVNPDQQIAFRQAGGEIIFNLPNGLQGYLLVDAKDERIDEAPIAVVADKLETAGSRVIVNGLSCMGCHHHGTIAGFTDEVRAATTVKGVSLAKVHRQYVVPQEMDKMLAEDGKRFLTAAEAATKPFLRAGQSYKDREPIGPFARAYRSQHLTLEDVAIEVGLRRDQASRVKSAILKTNLLQKLGLTPLANGGTISREVWETRQFGLITAFEAASSSLQLGLTRKPAAPTAKAPLKTPPRPANIGVDPDLPPTFATVTLKAGFVPDPFTKKVVAGGPLKINLGGVAHHLAVAPDFKLTYTAGNFSLTFRTVSTADTTLLVRTPSGVFFADDDSGGNLQAKIRIGQPQSGVYSIWVGTFGDALAEATLIITELE